MVESCISSRKFANACTVIIILYYACKCPIHSGSNYQSPCIISLPPSLVPSPHNLLTFQTISPLLPSTLVSVPHTPSSPTSKSSRFRCRPYLQIFSNENVRSLALSAIQGSISKLEYGATSPILLSVLHSDPRAVSTCLCRDANGMPIKSVV